MVKRKWKNQKGFALLFVLLVFSITFILVTSVFIFTHSQMKQEVDLGKDMKAIHFAEAGLHYALEYLNNSDSSMVPDENIMQGYINHNTDDGLLIEGVIYKVDDDGSTIGNYVVRISTDGLDYVIRSTGWSTSDGENNKRTVEATVFKKWFTDYLYFFNSNYIVPDGSYINGPYHCNEELSFEDDVTFSNVVTYAGDEYVGPLDNFHPNHLPQKVSSIDFPSTPEFQETLANLKDIAETDVLNYAYNGDTRIYLRPFFMDISQIDPVSMEWVTSEDVPLPGNGVIYIEGDVYISGEANSRLNNCHNR